MHSILITEITQVIMFRWQDWSPDTAQLLNLQMQKCICTGISSFCVYCFSPVKERNLFEKSHLDHHN